MYQKTDENAQMGQATAAVQQMQPPVSGSANEAQVYDNQKYAIVGIDGSYGLIDRQGILVVTPKYKSITILENGYFLGNEALYDVNEKRVIVNNNSVIFVPDGYFNAELLDNGLILVSNINKYGCKRWGCVNQVGTIIIPPLYHSLSYSAGLLLASICNDDDFLERTEKTELNIKAC